MLLPILLFLNKIWNDLPESSTNQKWYQIGNEYSQQNIFVFEKKSFFLEIGIYGGFFTTGIIANFAWGWGFAAAEAVYSPFPEKYG